MNEGIILSLISGAMVLILLMRGMSRRARPADSLRLALIWAAIIITATSAVMLGRRLIG